MAALCEGCVHVAGLSANPELQIRLPVAAKASGELVEVWATAIENLHRVPLRLKWNTNAMDLGVTMGGCTDH